MVASFQIIPATLDHTAEILALEQLCYPSTRGKRLIRPFIVAAALPNKGFIARVVKEGETIVTYASTDHWTRSFGTRIIAERK